MFNRLSLRLGLPIAAGVLLLWGFLTVFVLGSISRFAGERAERDLISYGREASDILDDAYDRLVLTGKVADPSEVRVAKANSLARLEKYFRRTGVPARVAAQGGETILNFNLDSPDLQDWLRLPAGRAQRMVIDGMPRDTFQVEFPLWGWRLLLVESDEAYAQLAERVRNLYLGTGGLLVLSLAGFLYFSQRVVSRPVGLIARALERGERPVYTGIAEFSSLADSIRGMMDSLVERERLVRVGRTWYRQMFESAPVMMFSLARGGWFTDVNRSLCEHSGYSRDILLSSPASEVLDVSPGLLEELWNGVPLSRVPALLRTRDGQMRRMLLDAVLTEEPSGKLVVLAVVIDVTDQLRTESELIAARDAAEAANKAKSEFLANVSHEIRTPLNGVLGMLQLLEKSPYDQRQSGWVKNALDCGRSLLTLLGDILDFSSLEAGGPEPGPEPFAPAEILADIAQLFARQAEDKSVALTVDADENLPRTLMGEGGRLRQVLFNLAGNAVKFTDRGQVCLRVEGLGVSGSQGGEPARLLFTVEDTGIGIEESKLSRIFDPFTQADGSHTRRHQGAGLGLAIVKRLVGLWGGVLEIDTAPGVGTAVHFTMPVGPPPPGAQAPLPAPAHPAEESPGGRVLLAEDDPINTVMTMDMLETLGYRATIVENGAEALKALAQEDFDCLLMDIQMPEMDGLAATRAIRTAPALGDKARVPIVALTAHALPGDRERFLAAGMDDYLSKPVEYDDLAGVLVRAMRKTWRSRLS